LECPSTDLSCSSLAVPNPPHAIRKGVSLYPLDGVSRELLVYSRLIPCLHPLVCNGPGGTTQPSWESWPAYVQSTGGAERFLCRHGSDPESLMCSRCLAGYEPDGLLCRGCSGWWGPLVVVLCLVLIAGFLAWNVFRWQRISSAVGTASEHGSRKRGDHNFFAILLYFLQV
jgi:hypothetical protein